MSRSNIIQKPSWWVPLADYIFTVVLPYLISVPQQVSEFISARFVKTVLQSLGLIRPAKQEESGSDASRKDGLKIRKISDDLQFFNTSEDYNKTASKERRTLALFYPWLTAKERHVKKYVSLLTDVHADVLVVRITPLNALRPTTGTQVVAEKVCEFLRAEHDRYDQMMVYGCSVGAYAFCETVLKMHNDTELFDHVKRKFVGQVWDSPVDVQSLTVGLAHTITSIPYFQSLIMSYAKWFLELRHEAVTRHYERAAELMYECPIQCPTLYMYSTTDVMSTETITEGIADQWRAKGVEMWRRVFPKAPHVQNFTRYPQEYREIINKFLEHIKVAQKS